MGNTSLYDDDVCAWAEQQAAALRSLAGRRDLPNQLDLSNVAEEIEDVGKSEMRAVESLIGNVLVHVILLAADPGALAVRGWRGEIAAWTTAIRRRISPSMDAKIDMEELWLDAVRIACARLSDWDEDKGAASKNILAGSVCPLSVAAFRVDDFDVADALTRVRSLATGHRVD